MNGKMLHDTDYIAWVLLTQARDMMARLRTAELRKSGVSLAEAGVLGLVELLGETASPAEISRRLNRRHHTVLGILGRMERRGLLTRQVEHDSQGKHVRIALTEKGKKAARKSAEIGSIRSVMASLSETERTQMAACLRKLRDAAFKASPARDKKAIIFP